MSATLETVLGGLGFVEGLRWRAGRLWFSDFGSRTVQSLGPSGDVRREAWVPGQPSGLGFSPNGDLLVVSSHEGHVLRYGQDAHWIVADIGATYRGGLNDMITDRHGRSYVGAFPEPVIGSPSPDVPTDGGNVPLFLIDETGAARVVARGLKIPNGMAIAHDDATLLVAETMGNRIIAFRIGADGSLDDGRTYADLGHRNPDGVSLDRQGRLWVGCPFVSEFVRLTTTGEIDLIVPVPGRWAVSCAVGETDDEVWFGAVETTIDDYKAGRVSGAIMRWHS